MQRRLVVPAAVAVAVLAAAPSAAAAAEPAHSFFKLRAGSSMRLVLPGGFFGAGSRPLRATVRLVGRPLGSVGPFELGRADTVLAAGPGDPPRRGARRSLALRFAEIAWRGRRPLSVALPGGRESWTVRVGLSREAEQPAGRVRLRRTSRGGGTFHADLTLVPRITFRSPRGTSVVLDLGRPRPSAPQPPLAFRARSVAWRIGCPRRVLDAPVLSGRICLGARRTRGVAWTLRATTAGASSRLALGPAAPPTGRRPVVHRSARVGRGVTLGHGARIGRGARIGAGAVIGPRATIGALARIGRRAIVGARAVVRPRARISDRATADARSFVGTRARIAGRATLGARARLGSRAVLGARSRLGSRSRVGARSTIGSGVRAGIGVLIGVVPRAARTRGGGAARASQATAAPASVADGTFLAAGAIVARGTRQVEDLVTCVSPESPYLPAAPVAVTRCAVGGGTVQECSPSRATGRRDPVGSQITPTPGVPAGLGGQLAGDVGTAVAPPANGGTGQPYVATTHDCEDFADELERRLQARGHDATFTVYWRLNPDYAWYNALWTSKWIDGHAVTDVRRNGTTLWIEPQLPAASQPAGGVNLDFNRDGTVGASLGAIVDHTTDDGYRIEVYDSMQAALDAGHVLD